MKIGNTLTYFSAKQPKEDDHISGLTLLLSEASNGLKGKDKPPKNWNSMVWLIIKKDKGISLS